MISGEAQHKEARSNSEVSNLMAIEADIAIQDELEIATGARRKQYRPALPVD